MGGFHGARTLYARHWGVNDKLKKIKKGNEDVGNWRKVSQQKQQQRKEEEEKGA